jgi:hypothetical protein
VNGRMNARKEYTREVILLRVTPKRVDYGLCLQPDKVEMSQIEDVLAAMADDIPSINQSTAPMLRKRPLFCNLEIKKAYGGQDPRPQLGIWCSAGLTKMNESCARQSERVK